MSNSVVSKGKDVHRKEFLMSQYASARAEIEMQISERRKVEAQTFLGLAAIYAWIFSNAANMSSFYLTASLAIPFLFAILGLLRWGGIMKRTMTLGSFNMRLEEQITGENEGWEHFLQLVRSQQPFFGRLEGFAEVSAWLLAVLGSLTALIFSLR